MSNNKQVFTIDPFIIKPFRVKLLHWGSINIRSFPWRYRQDPYAVLLSEFMLHRTQVHQVVPVFEKVISLYPSLNSFCLEDRDKILKILLPLGLDWRLEGMIQTLHDIFNDSGSVPDDYDQLLAYRGIGPYIAGAVVCFTWNIPVALVDANTVRVTGRVFNISTKGEARRKKLMIDTIRSVCDPNNPRDFYYAMIDLAHLICKPKKPLCEQCPFPELLCSFYCSDSH